MSFLYSGSLWSSLYCAVSSLCVGLYRWLVKVSWLGKLVSVFCWVELYFFSLLSKSWVAFLGAWCPLPAIRSCFVEFTRCLNALLMNLWGRKCSSCPTPPPHVWLFMILRTVAHQAPTMGILQARILEWVAILFSRGSSRPRDQTCISCIAGGFLPVWATREVHK